MIWEDNLLCARRRAFVATTDSRHNLPVYPNLTREIKPRAMNLLWVADITNAVSSFYLAVVLDAFAARDRLGSGPHAGSPTCGCVAAHGAD
jgi:putative transposase